MKTTYYERMFNPCLYLIAQSIFLFLLGNICSLLTELLASLNLLEMKLFLNELADTTFKASLICLCLTFLLIGIEGFQRLKNDTLANLYQSIKQTLMIRKFLKQRRTDNPAVIAMDTPAILKNYVRSDFNSAVRQAIVNIQTNHIAVTLRRPDFQQSQAILRGMEAHIREELSSRNLDYYFSGATRKGNLLIFVGNKR